MGKRDLDLKSYLSDRRRYADIYNGSIFQGGQLLKAEELEPVETVVTRAGKEGRVERTSDIVMRQKTTGDLFALWILENQETIDYSMPVRVMLKEALEYDRQVKELKRANAAEYKKNPKNCGKGGVRHSAVTSGEYLYKVRKGERIYPVNTLIVYWGKEPWDGPKSLHDFLDFGSEDIQLQKELKRLVPEYPLHILDLNADTDYSKFQTELRTVFELYRYRNDKKEFMEYVEGHEECRHLDEESCRIIGRFTNTENLLLKTDKDKEEKDMDVGTAIWDIREEGVQEGFKRGISQGISQGISRGMKALVEAYKELGCTKEEAVTKLMEKCTLSQSEAEKYAKEYGY
ncbi:MAG: hypothetical protein HDR00_05205 [Lachnospiraceae bacterium]|nr:hypothetical protein [Lachnospiraceae bacterium]